MPLLPLKVATSGSTGSGVFLSMHSMYFQLFTQISCLVSVVLVLSQWRRVRHKGLWDVNEWEQKCNLLHFGSLLVYTKEKWIQSSLIVSGNPAGFDGCHPNIPTVRFGRMYPDMSRSTSVSHHPPTHGCTSHLLAWHALVQCSPAFGEKSLLDLLGDQTLWLTWCGLTYIQEAASVLETEPRKKCFSLISGILMSNESVTQAPNQEPFLSIVTDNASPF